MYLSVSGSWGFVFCVLCAIAFAFCFCLLLCLLLWFLVWVWVWLTVIRLCCCSVAVWFVVYCLLGLNCRGLLVGLVLLYCLGYYMGFNGLILMACW